MRKSVASAMVAGAILACSAAGQATFTQIGDIAGGDIHSEANGVSFDGMIVVGWSSSGTNQTVGVRFIGGVLSAFGDLSGGAVANQAFAIADNEVIVGQGGGTSGPEGYKYHGGRYRAMGGRVAGGIFGSRCTGVDNSGRLTVGVIETSPGVREAALWTAFIPNPLGYLPGGGSVSQAFGISGDGAWVVGSSDSTNGTEAFRSNSETGMMGLGDLPGGFTFSEAKAISDNGLVIVGASDADNGQHAFRWTGAGGMMSLGTLPGSTAPTDEARAVSAAGTVIVGRAFGPNSFEAFIWDSGAGMRSLKQVLIDAGVTGLEFWTLSAANGISNNASVICGTGVNPEGHIMGWVATLPVAPPCRPDYDGDGFLTGLDFDGFVVDFELGLLSTDYDGDGFITGLDFDAYVEDFEAGC